MSPYRPGRRAMLALCALLSISGWVRAENDAAPPAGEQLYQKYCSQCHDHPTDRIPARDSIASRPADEVLQILTVGPMRTQAAGLSMPERLTLITYLTGHAPSLNTQLPPETNLCPNSTQPVRDTGPSWNGWGRDLENSRYQPEPGFTAADVPRLHLRWAYGYRGSYVYGQPSIVGGRVYVSNTSGRVYSLDMYSGCTHWTFDAAGPVRTALSIIPVREHGSTRLYAIFGDDLSFLYAVDAASGQLLWKQRLDTHPDARITGAPAYLAGRLYVPVSSLEELSAPVPTYECCRFRGSVAALDVRTGRQIWRTYTIPEPARQYGTTATGVPRLGPAGAAVWDTPTLDPQRHLLYVGTGNSYTDVPTEHTDSILALDMKTGAIRWANQLRSADNYIVGCTPEIAGQGNCPKAPGPDVDFGTSPILHTLPGGRQLLLTGQKSGHVYALEPDSGKVLWDAQVGTGSSLGGIEWGGAADEQRMYVAVSDAATSRPGGLAALRIADGRLLWHTDPPPPICSWGLRNCLASQSQAVSAMPGAVFSGSQDGHLRAYDSADGHIIWDFDTARIYETVNGVPAAGGSLDAGGATMAGGMLFVNSGYGRILGQPGNVLLAFGVD